MMMMMIYIYILKMVPSVSLHAVRGSEWISEIGTGKLLTHVYFPKNALACELKKQLDL